MMDKKVFSLFRVTKDPQFTALAAQKAEHLLMKRNDGTFHCASHSCEADECIAPVAQEKGDTVWEGTMDDGLYYVKVERVGPYLGLLKISRAEDVFYQEPVGLQYDAKYGADAEDINNWMRMAEAEVDDDYARREETPPKCS